MRSTAIKFLLGLGIFAGGTLVGADRVEAQLVVVDAKYRIVEVDRNEKRIGVALPDAAGNERQNWLYIKDDTRSSRRHVKAGGGYRDEAMTPDAVLNAAEARIGGMLKIHGGRDLDGSINAKKVWM